MKKLCFVLCLTALLAALPASAQVDFTRYVALGDSLTAGYASASLHEDHQRSSYPVLLAQQAGAATFEGPWIAHPGLPPILELVSLDGPVLAPSQDPPPANPYDYFYNVTYPMPYNNLGVPGSNLYDLLFTTGDINNFVAGNLDNVMHDLILRTPEAPNPADPSQMVPTPAIAQAIAQNPTFVTMWIGNNDILGAALYGTPIEGVTMTPVDIFAQLYQQALGALVTMTSADIVVMTLPYATAVPYVTTVPPYVNIPGVGVVPLEGTNGTLPPDALVTLGAAALIRQGYGIPGSNLLLPEDIDPATGAPGFVLRPEEVEIINGRIDAFNGIIKGAAAAMGVPVLDVNRFFNEYVNGEVRSFGGWTPSVDFLTGGIFSYDGVHPQNIGYALIAMELIDLVNEQFGATIPQLNFDQILCAGGCAGQGVYDPDKAAEVVLSDKALQGLLDAFPLLGEFGPQNHTASATE